MTDPVLAAVWTAVLAVGVGGSMLARRRGLSATHARDLLHVGAGVWVLGWPWWHGVVAPMTLVAAALVAVALVPVAAGRFAEVDRFRRGVAQGDEIFGGLVVYTLAFGVMTWLGLTRDPFPAAAALWALALGDGVGGLVGRRWGRLEYALPWGKPKTFEGSLAVAVFAAAGALAAVNWFGIEVPVWHVPALGLAAAVTEALAPRGTDNALVPGVVWGLASLLT